MSAPSMMGACFPKVRYGEYILCMRAGYLNSLAVVLSDECAEAVPYVPIGQHTVRIHHIDGPASLHTTTCHLSESTVIVVQCGAVGARRN